MLSLRYKINQNVINIEITKLVKIIIKTRFIRSVKTTRTLVNPNGITRSSNWLFPVRKVILDASLPSKSCFGHVLAINTQFVRG